MVIFSTDFVGGVLGDGKGSFERTSLSYQERSYARIYEFLLALLCLSLQRFDISQVLHSSRRPFILD